MYGRNDPSHLWSVHAELTISHGGQGDPNTAAPFTRTAQDENGVHMVYTWTSQPASQSQPGAANFSHAPSSTLSDAGSTCTTQQGAPSCGFQKGNLLFSSTPPRRPFNFNDTFERPNPNRLGVNVHDSGYSGSDLSPNSFPSHGFPRRPIQSYNRRCRSTCSIILSTDVDNGQNTTKYDIQTNVQPLQAHCGRTQSLRCQTPTIRSDKKDDTFYGCGDPWCYHSATEDGSQTGRCSPVLETSENSSKIASEVGSFDIPHFNTPNRSKSSPPRIVVDSKSKDASSQTLEMRDKCTSPYQKIPIVKDTKTEKSKKEKRLKTRSSYNQRRKTSNADKDKSSGQLFSPDSLESPQSDGRRLVRSPAKIRGVSPLLDKKGSASDSKSGDQSKKPRTVHIDVYCTGSENSSDSDSSSSSDNKTVSSPQTVFESQKVKVTHRRTSKEELPFNIRNLQVEDAEKPKSRPREEESDIDDGISTAYPSQMSSFSKIGDFGSSYSSVPPSWSTVSMSSCTVPDDYDSIAGTSWKDTVSDFGNFSRASLAPTESLDFVPISRPLPSRRSESIEEGHEVVSNPSGSILPSDSFEYAESEDRRRIKKMEEMWKTDSKSWKSPQTERKHLMQKQKLKAYMDKRMSDNNLPRWISRESDSEGTDSSEKGWSFVRSDEKRNIKRDDTVRRASKESEHCAKSTGTIVEPEIIHAKLTLDKSLREPFTIVPGIHTDPLTKAKKFGSTVGAFKKPGHHIGPAKNPDCLCDHCIRYYANRSPRNRTRSVGDAPLEDKLIKWRELLKSSKAPVAKP